MSPEINYSQKNIATILSHDLTTPLAQIKSTLALTESNPSFFEKIKDRLLLSVENGLGIIDLVRRMRAAEDKELVLSKINILESINESIELIKNRLEDKNIQVELEIPSDLVIVSEKVSLVNSVFNNLFTNAIKFSYENSKITIKAFEKNNKINFIMQDYGVGISKEIIDNIFNVTASTTQIGTKGEKGTGFGMPLIKKFIDRYNGSIKINSKDEKSYPDDHGTIIEIVFVKG